MINKMAFKEFQLDLVPDSIDAFYRRLDIPGNFKSIFGDNYGYALVIAGGFGKSLVDDTQPLTDIDVFVTGTRSPSTPADMSSALFSPSGNREVIHDNKDLIDNLRYVFENKGYVEIFRCPEDKLTTYEDGSKNKIQLITEFAYHNAGDLLTSFDFTVTQFRFLSLSVPYLYTNLQAIQDTLTKTLRLHDKCTLPYPVATLNRVYKFKERGYNIRPALRQIVQILSTRESRDLTFDEMRWYID